MRKILIVIVLIIIILVGYRIYLDINLPLCYGKIIGINNTRYSTILVELENGGRIQLDNKGIFLIGEKIQFKHRNCKLNN